MKSKNGLKGVFTGFAGIVIPVLIVVAFIIYYYVMGNPENFQGNNVNNLPKPGNYLGIIFKGGIIVPILMGILMMVITFSIERWITITKAKGKGSISAFVIRVYQKLSPKEIDSAIQECDRQRGSVANVIKAGLLKYQQVFGVKEMNKDQKIVTIKQEIEEATSLEMPILEQNLVILATIAPLLPFTVFPFIVYQQIPAYGQDWGANFRAAFLQLIGWNGLAHLWFLYYLIIYYFVFVLLVLFFRQQKLAFPFQVIIRWWAGIHRPQRPPHPRPPGGKYRRGRYARGAAAQRGALSQTARPAIPGRVGRKQENGDWRNALYSSR